MKEMAVLLLICAVLCISGCAQQTSQGQPSPTPGPGNNMVTPTATETANAVPTPTATVAIPGAGGNLTPGNAALYNDVESIAKEVEDFNADDLGDAMVPITADDINID